MLRVRCPRLHRIAVDQRARVERGEQPLVRIDDERVGVLDAGEQPAHGRRGETGSAVRAVDVQPPAVLLRDGRDARDVVDDAEVRRARGGDDGEHAVAALGRHRLHGPAQRGAEQAAALVAVDLDDIDVHDDAQRVLDRRVRLGRQRHRPPGRTAPTSVQRILARRDQRRQVADRAALHERTAGLGRQPGEICEPAQGLVPV